MGQFALITSESGTLVTVYNMNLNSDGLAELDVESDLSDIKMSDSSLRNDPHAQLAHKSFREYVSILYLNPRMKIYIQNKRVLTKRLDRIISKPIVYKFPTEQLMTVAAKEKEDAETLYLSAGETLKLVESKSISNRIKFGQNKFAEKVEQARVAGEVAKDFLKVKTRNLEENSSLTFTFGVNLENKFADGLFIYSANRLTLMFLKTKEQETNENLRGIVGIVDIPHSILKSEPNKQGFQDAVSIQSLVRSMGERLEIYGRSINLNSEFWNKYKPHRTLSKELSPNKMSICAYPSVLQCTRCLKWRLVAAEFSQGSYENWTCLDNPDRNLNKCDLPESLETIPTRRELSPPANPTASEGQYPNPKKRILSIYERVERQYKKARRSADVYTPKMTSSMSKTYLSAGCFGARN